MTPEEKALLMEINAKLDELIRTERYTFQKPLQILDGRNIQVGSGTGTKIGTEATQKLSVFGVTPVVQSSKISDPTGGVTTDAEARARINAILDALEAFGITASS